MGMAAILFNGAEPIKQIVNILSREDPMWNLVKTVQAVWGKKIFKHFTILYIYIAKGQAKAHDPKLLTVAKQQFYYFNHTL